MLVSSAMPEVLTQELERLPLRVDTLLAGVPLHDVWFVDLPRWRAGVTLDSFLRTVTSCLCRPPSLVRIDRKSTRLNSSHVSISYAVFCLKKKKNYSNITTTTHEYNAYHCTIPQSCTNVV